MAEIQPTALVAPTVVNGTSKTHTQSDVPVTNGTAKTPSSSSHTQSKSEQSPSSAYPVFQFPSNLPRPPFIDVTGVPNFRSLGGYISSNGTQITRPDLFYRCAHLTQITPEGLDQLSNTLGVKAIYDLRSGPEVQRTTAGVVAAVQAASQQTSETQPPTIPSQSDLYNSLRNFSPVYATEDYGPDALARKLKWYSSTSSAHHPEEIPYDYSEGFVNAYRDIAIHGAKAYTKIFRHILTRPQDPFVFHCTAGKDRTGVFGALLLRLAGVNDETIAWEYSLTEPGLGSWRTLFIDRMSRAQNPGARIDVAAKASGNAHEQTKTSSAGAAVSSFEAMTREEASRVCGSRAGNMRAWLKLVLDGEFGGQERYLTEICGFNSDEVEAIRRNLVTEIQSASDGVSGQVVIKPEAIQVSGWTPYGGCEDTGSSIDTVME